jgi:hypothetical protein
MDFVYYEALTKDFSNGSLNINEVVLGSWVNKGQGTPPGYRRVPDPNRW